MCVGVGVCGCGCEIKNACWGCPKGSLHVGCPGPAATGQRGAATVQQGVAAMVRQQGSGVRQQSCGSGAQRGAAEAARSRAAVVWQEWCHTHTTTPPHPPFTPNPAVTPSTPSSATLQFQCHFSHRSHLNSLAEAIGRCLAGPCRPWANHGGA